MREWWRRVATVRLQTTLVAVVVTGVALAGAAFAVLGAVRSDITERLHAQVVRSAAVVAKQVSAGLDPKGIVFQAPVGYGFVPPSVEVIDVSSGAVVAAIRPGVSIALTDEGGPARIPLSEPLDASRAEADLISFSEEISVDGRLLRIVASTPATPVEDNTAALSRSLAAGFPVLVVLVGAVTWLLAGRALRPVEQIRAEVEEISGHTLERRVPAPATDDEVGRLAQTMNRMLDRLQASSVRQREFVSDASHELRSPVAAIRTELEVALREPSSADWALVASNALAENERLERLVDDLLTLARLDEGRVPAAEDVDLDDVAREEAARLRDPRLTVDVRATPVRGNREQLARVIRNLLENASRYADDRIALSVASSDGLAVVTVADDGPGIPAADRERVFERFTRLDEARARSGGGVGLGLALVRAIAEAHGGAASVAGNVPGARVEVRLPRSVRG